MVWMAPRVGVSRVVRATEYQIQKSARVECCVVGFSILFQTVCAWQWTVALL